MPLICPPGRGVFIGVRLKTESAKRALTLLPKLPGLKPLPLREMHITIAYSKTPLLREYPVCSAEGISVKPMRVQRIGNAIALLVEGQWLRERAKLAKRCGARGTFPGFIPHLSLSYDIPPDVQLEWCQPKTMELGPLFLDYEYIEPLKDK